ncbi:adhesion G-protein coupled receptor G2-like [Salminus brasiliensis]|uniref:adhesion G-protein coupled receptor G2-like n=1 Tax=Salminus brasiliensis TaxID=930266 RepID=UPI003B830893
MRKEDVSRVILFLLVFSEECGKLTDAYSSINILNSMLQMDKHLEGFDLKEIMRSIMDLEKNLENTQESLSQSLNSRNLTVYLHKTAEQSGNITVHANDTMAAPVSSDVPNRTVEIFLPEEIVAKPENRIVFCLITSPEQFKNIINNRIIGVSVSGKKVSGLTSRVRISVRVGPTVNVENKTLQCVFYNYTSSEFEDTGCSTIRSIEEDWVHCLCNHLTYFAILMVPGNNVSKEDQLNLTYISLTGCSLSLLFLVITVLLYFIKWRAGADQSQRIHICLAVALIFLNLHFIVQNYIKNKVFCIYVAVLLHYFLLATFTWMAIEGFHLYLLLVRVFNIHIRRYVLKLSLVGWGVPAVVVTLIFIIDRNIYLNVGSSLMNSTSYQGCHISNDVVRNITVLGFFCVVFAFNLSLLVVLARTIFCRHSVPPGQQMKPWAKSMCTVLGITCLLGICWSVGFFAYNTVITVFLYLFCILNPLQGFFIFLWFCISKCKRRQSLSSTDRHATSTATAVS